MMEDDNISVKYDDTRIPHMKRIVEHAILEEKSQNLIEDFIRRKSSMPKLVTEQYDDDKIGIEKQLNTSSRAIGEMLQDGHHIVSNIRLANDARELERRVKEAELREELLEALQKETIISQTKFDEISSKWAGMDDGVDPVEIHLNLQAQKNRIASLMGEKMKIINECRDELVAADERYIKDMEKQNDDITTLIERIDKQIEVAKRTFREHLDLLEKTIEDERKILKLVTTKKWEIMYDKHNINEEMKIRREREKMEYYNSELNRIQLEHEELIRATKIRLELDNQALEIEVQKLKRNIMLNSEKLDYNFQVLKKREDENVMVRNQQKRRLAKLAETIVSLKRKLKEAKQTCISETQKFTADIMKLHGKILELERKSDLFAEQNDKKFMNVWDINFEECQNYMEQILRIDRLLWEKQLDKKWEPPEIKIVKKEDLKSYKKAVELVGEKEKKSETLALIPKISEEPEKSREQILVEEKILRMVFRAIADNAGFLIEEKLKVLLKPYTQSERTLVNLDAVFMALGITHSEEIDYIKDYFTPYTKCTRCNENPYEIGTELKDLYECTLGGEHDLEICTMDVYKGLCKFTREHKTSVDKMMPTGSITSRMSKTKDTVTRMIDPKDIELCFNSFDFPEEREKVWKVLEEGLTQYHGALKERETLQADCEFLRKQNQELTQLLAKYVPDDFE